MSEVTTGVRAGGTLPANFDYDLEMIKQTGSLGPKSIPAWAGHWNAGYSFLNARSRPRIFVEYNYASGNDNPGCHVWGTHDQSTPRLTTRWNSPISSVGRTLKTYRQP